MARPHDPVALTRVKGKKHLTKEEKAKEDDEIYAADGDISPPSWMGGIARKHFEEMAAYMKAVNGMAGKNIYGSVDVGPLILMSVSYQKSREFMAAEQKAKRENDQKAADAAQKKRLAEDRSYRDFMRTLRLDPGSRVNVGSLGGDGREEEEDEF